MKKTHLLGDKSKAIAIGLTLLIAGILLAMVIMAAVPPVSRDALTHHLAVPKLYLKLGKMQELPEIIPSYFPMNLDLLYLIALKSGGDILPKYVHMAFGVLTAAVLFGYLRRRINNYYGLLGVFLFLSLPIIVQLSITVYVDLGLVFFSTSAMACLIEWRRQGFKTRYLILSASFCGLALGTKYNGLVVFFLLTLMVPLLASRRSMDSGGQVNEPYSWQDITRFSIVFAAVALLFFAPWAIRNMIWTGNPVYPLYDEVFNPQNPYLETRLNPFAIRRLVYGEALWETLLVPLRIFFQGMDDVPAYFDGRLNPCLLPFAIIGLFSTKEQADDLKIEKMVWGSFAMLLILIVFFTRDMRIRYIAPAIPPLVILSVFGIWNLFGRLNRIYNCSLRNGMQIATIIGVMVFVFLNVAYLYQKWLNVRPMEYLRGQVDRASYITRYRPEYPVILHANQNLNERNRLLCLFLGNRRYYFDVDAVFFEWTQFKDLIISMPDTQKLTEILRQKGISHVMLGKGSLQYWSQKTLRVEDQKKLQHWVQDELEIIYDGRDYALLQIRQ